jgi:dTDP-4-dehydrorhamnose reductase
MRHVVLIGSNGQLGTDLTPALAEFRVTGLTHADRLAIVAAID